MSAAVGTERRSWDRPLVQLRRCSLVILYSAHGLCSLLTPRTIYMHSVSPTTMLFSSGRNQLVVWWRTTSFARQGSRNAYVASAIHSLLSELTTFHDGISPERYSACLHWCRSALGGHIADISSSEGGGLGVAGGGPDGGGGGETFPHMIASCKSSKLSSRADQASGAELRFHFSNANPAIQHFIRKAIGNSFRIDITWNEHNDCALPGSFTEIEVATDIGASPCGRKYSGNVSRMDCPTAISKCRGPQSVHFFLC